MSDQCSFYALMQSRETQLPNILKCHGKPNCQISKNVTETQTVKYLKMSRETQTVKYLKMSRETKAVKYIKMSWETQTVIYLKMSRETKL